MPIDAITEIQTDNSETNREGESGSLAPVRQSPMFWRDFVDIEFIALNAKHASGASSAILTFYAVGWLAEKVIKSIPILTGIHFTEKIVVGTCIGYLTLAILWEIVGKAITLLKGGKNGSARRVLDT